MNISWVNMTLISDVISWVEGEHEIMSDEGFFKRFMSEKKIQFSETEEAPNTDCSNRHLY